MTDKYVKGQSVLYFFLSYLSYLKKITGPLIDVNNFGGNRRAEGVARFDSKELYRHFNLHLKFSDILEC